MNNRSANLKRMARAALAGKWGTAALLSFFTLLITSALTFCTTPFEGSTTILGMSIYWIITLIVSLLSGLFAAGTSYFYLNIARGEEFGFGDLFYAFKHNPDRFLIVALITGAPTFLSTIPTFFMNPVTEQEMITYALVSLGSMYISSIISIILALFFALSNYLLVDFDELGAIDSLRLSAHLMKGNKGRYFYISLSFLGWIFLSILTLGIALFWIEPYMNMTFTYFYADILNRNQPDYSEPTVQADQEQSAANADIVSEQPGTNTVYNEPAVSEVSESPAASDEAETEELPPDPYPVYSFENHLVDDDLFEDE